MERVEALMAEQVGVSYPSAVACVLHRGEMVFHHAVGDATPDTIFDLASLTKPMATATLLAHALTDGAVRLDDRVFDDVTVAHLAGHASGLPAWLHVEPGLDLTALPRGPTGGKAVYSDIGYMILGRYLERALGASLDDLFGRVREWAGLTDTRYGVLAQDMGRVAPTEDCPERGGVIRGAVHDPNCWRLGGVCGHAGLFGTASEVARWAQGLLNAYDGDGPVGQQVIRTLWSTSASRAPTTWRLGWDTPSPGGRSLAGRHFGPASVGHYGFTGTSVWTEPNRVWVVVLLSNRVHPRVVEPPPLKRFRPVFHDAVCKSLLG